MSKKNTSQLFNAIVYITNKLWLLAALLIIATALCFTLLRLLLPQTNYFKEDLESWFEKQFQVSLDIERIDARWGELGPVFEVSGLQINTSQADLDLVSFESFLIHVDGLGSFLNKTLVTDRIDVKGAVLNFALGHKLGLSLDTAAINAPQKSNLDGEVEKVSEQIFKVLFAQNHLTLLDSKISLSTRSGKQFNYLIDQLSIRNFEQIHQLSGELKDPYGGQIKLVAEIHGDPAKPGSKTNLYLQGADIQLNSLPVFETQTHLKPDQGLLNFRIWATWQDRRWQSALGDLELRNTEWFADFNQEGDALSGTGLVKPTEPIATLEHFAANFNWQFESDSSGRLSLNQLKIENEQQNYELPEVSLLFNAQNEGNLIWDLIINELEISPYLDYLDVIFSKSLLKTDVFKTSGLSLSLKPLAIRLPKKQGVWYLPQVATKVNDLYFDQLFGLPKFNGVQGYLDFMDGIGSVNLTGHHVSFDFNDLFRDPIDAEEFSADLTWQLLKTGEPHLIFDQIKLKNSDLSLTAKGQFLFENEKPTIALYAEAYQLDASQKSRYLPTGIMTTGLVDYLDNSVISGHLPWVKSILSGALPQFPFTRQDGLFSVLAELQQGEYRFLPDWPIASQVEARLWFEGNRMDIEASSAVSEHNQVNYASAVIADMTADESQLDLSLLVDSVDNSGQEFLRQSPLSHIGNALKILDYRGKLTTQLELAVPLNQPDNLSVQGFVTPDKNLSEVTLAGMRFDRLNGKIQFTQQGVTDSALKARYHQRPLQVALLGPKNSEDPVLKVKADGVIDSNAAGDFLGPRWLPYLAGTSTFQALVDIGDPKTEISARVEFFSDLEGISFNLPGEFAKASDEKTPFKLALDLAELNQAEVSWQSLKGKWQWPGNPLDSKHGNLGGVFSYRWDEALPPIIPGEIQVNAKLLSAQVASWSDFLDQVIHYPSETELSAESSDLAAQTDDNELDAFPTLKLQLDLQRLENPVAELKQLKINAVSHSGTDWLVDLTSPLINGQLEVIPDQPWQLKLSKADLKLLKPPVSEEPKQSKEPETSAKTGGVYLPGNWPDMTISCGSCVLDGKPLGEVKANLRSESQHLSLTGQLALEKSHQLNFDLQWQQSPLSDEQSAGPPVHNTRLGFNLEAGNFGELMKQWYQDISVEDSRATIAGTIFWPDLPWQFEPLQIQGDVSFKLGKGSLSQINDASAHLVSLFNIQLLAQRLILDFKDVFKKGFFYDSISGDASLYQGKVTTDNLFIDGNAAKVSLQGDIDLNTRQIEQGVTVIPQLTSSLPVLVGWAVEPTTGLLMFLLNKIIEPAIDVVTQVEYRIHGSLDDIQMDQIKKSKSKVKVDIPEEPTKEPESSPAPVGSESDPEPVKPETVQQG